MLNKVSAALLVLTVGAGALSVHLASAATSQPVTWADMSAMDLRPAFKSQYSSAGNLFEPVISDSSMDLVMRDADSRISADFHVPETLKPAVRFWLRVYSEFTTQHVVIYDSHHPELIYEVLDFRSLAQTSRNKMVYEIVSKKRVQNSVAAYRKAFASLARNPRPKKPSREETHILSALKNLSHKHSFAELRHSLRTQTGQRDNIIKGLLAAETFFPKMEQIFVKMGVPLELTRLTLVESSFNLNARSKVGASGVWQFMPKSGKEYLLIDENSGIDERISPLKSTVAAAKLLKRNRRMLGHWALTVTSFNHGTRGLPRLNAKEAEFTQFAHLFDSCSKKRGQKHLGYASRNYYAEYLAVLHAEAYRNLFYGAAPRTVAPSVAFKPVPPGKTALQIAMEHGIPLQEFQLYNPDIPNLRKTLPRGVFLAIPGEGDDTAMLIGPQRSKSARRTQDI